MGLGKETSTGEIPSSPLVFMWGGVACLLDACGPPCEYGVSPKTPALMSLV